MSVATELQGALSLEQSALTAIQSEIEECNEHIRTIKKIDTSVTYNLESHENIKETYHLAGTPYLNMTETEMETVNDAESKFKAKKSEILELLNTKLSELSTSAMLHQMNVTSLTLKVSLAKAAEAKSNSSST